MSTLLWSRDGRHLRPGVGQEITFADLAPRAALQQLATNAGGEAPRYEFEPMPGDPGWRSDGPPDLNQWREHLATKERQAHETRQRQAFLANMKRAGSQYEFEKAPGDPGFHFTRPPMPGDPGWQGGAQ